MAKIFKFRLDPLLRLRGFKARDAEKDLARTVGERLKVENHIAERKKYLADLIAVKPVSSSAEDLRAMIWHKDFVKGEIVQAKASLVEVLKIEKKKRAILSELLKEEKIMIKLKEKQHIVYKEELNREEVIIMDEIAVNRHGKVERF